MINWSELITYVFILFSTSTNLCFIIINFWFVPQYVYIIFCVVFNLKFMIIIIIVWWWTQHDCDVRNFYVIFFIFWFSYPDWFLPLLFMYYYYYFVSILIGLIHSYMYLCNKISFNLFGHIATYRKNGLELFVFNF